VGPNIRTAIDGDDAIANKSSSRLKDKRTDRDFGKLVGGFIQDFVIDTETLAVALQFIVEPVDDHCPMVGGRQDEGDLARQIRHGPPTHETSSQRGTSPSS
jgi:hypothetical protein